MTTQHDDRADLVLRVEELTKRFSEGWHDGIKIDATDIATLSEAAALLADGKAGGEAQRVCAEVYQVVGSLLSDLGVFETEHASKVLDNLSQARLVHDDVLPWPSFERHPRSQAVAQGWKLVPVEPTKEMIVAGYAGDFDHVCGHDIGEDGAREIWAAMLSASPAAPAAAQVAQPLTESNAVMHLRALVTALDNAFISSWQSTAAWQKELDLAKEFLGIGKDQG